MSERTDELRKSLLRAPKNGYDRISGEECRLVFKAAEDYKTFLSRSKTERDAVMATVELAEAAGFVPYSRGMALEPGSRVYTVNRGKSIALAKEILAFADDSTSTKVAALKCRALSQMAECESELGHVDEAQRLLLQCIDIMMESSQHATKFGETDPLIYTLLTLNDLYIDNKMPERALPLMTKMDTAIIRLANCPDTPDRVIQIRRNYMTISKAMIYALTGQRKQAEVLLWRSRLPMFFTLDQSADEGGTMN